MSHDHHGHTHHDHAPEHSHAHGHGPSGISAARRILYALALTATFMVVEVVGGILSGSLALLADAGHMVADVGALGLAYLGIRLAARPIDAKRSYGYRRFEVLAAFVNGIVLLVLTLWIGIEAAHRLLAPVAILSGPMLVVAVIGLLVNVAGFFILHGASKDSLNVHGALLHVVSDLLGSIAAVAAALMIRFTGWTVADPLLSILVAVLILRSGWILVKSTGHILIEGTPEHVDTRAIQNILSEMPGVIDAHHIHVWSLTSGQSVATLHLRLAVDADAKALLPLAKQRLRERFGIAHATIEIDAEDCADGQHADDPDCMERMVGEISQRRG